LHEVTEQTSLLTPLEADYRAARRRVERYRDKRPSLFDALLAELSGHLKLPVWTFDSHFDMMQVQVWRA